MNKFKSVGVVLYDGFNSLDVAGPFQVFYWLKEYTKEYDIELYLIGPKKGGKVNSRENIQWIADYGWDDAPEQFDILFVPGGNGPDFQAVVANKDPKFKPLYDLLETRAPTAKLVTSVCVGALILAEAGLLTGYQCTTHWALMDQLAQYPGVRVAPGYPRYILDRNRITGGGVSSGIDEGLIIAEIVGGAEMARKIQLTIQYAPNPPFNSGDPSTASATTLFSIMNG